MRIQQLSAEFAVRTLQSTPDGLSDAEAARREAEYGPNRVEHVRRQSLLHRFLNGFTHFFALILFAAAALAFFAAWRRPGEGMGGMGVAILIVILVNGLFSFWQEYKAERAVAVLQRLLPHEVNVLRGGRAVRLPAERLVPGDVVRLAEGDDIPADCRVLESAGLRVNNATLTGESVPLARGAAPSDEPEVLHAANVLLAGTSVVSGKATALVFATGMHSEFGKIAHLTQSAGELLSPLQRQIIHVSRLIAALAAVLGGVFFLAGRAVGLPFWDNFIFAIGVIVANVPEGLLPTVTLALALASQRMARRNALVRHLPSVEALGSATVICTDKTGTLTENRMMVRQIYVSDGTFPPAAMFDRPDLRERYRGLADVAAGCHDLSDAGRGGAGGGPNELRGDPMEVALVEMARAAVGTAPVFRRVAEAPFDTDRKRLSTLHETPHGLVLYTKGAPETVLPLCDRIGTASGGADDDGEPLTDDTRAKFVEAQREMAAQGLRVLAMALRHVPADEWAGQAAHQEDPADGATPLEHGLVLVGLVGLEDPPRPEVPEAVERCREAGIRVIMVTGDHPVTAKAIARQIGLSPAGVEPVVVHGDDLRRMSPAQLQLALDAPHILFARVTADQKMLVVRALKRKRQVVAVTGDGVNDAPALKEADIGIAMGRGGTDVAREAADMVLLDDNFASIVAAVEEGRAVYANIRKFMTYILSSNVPELVPYLAFVLFRVPLALTIIQILAVDLGTDMLPALALGAQPPDPDIMRAPPRPPGRRLLDLPLLLRSYGFLGLIQAAAAMGAFFFVLRGAGWRYGQGLANADPLYRRATTACLAAIVVMQMMNVFVCRHERASAFRIGRRGVGIILLGLASELALILAIVYTRPGHLLFGTAPIGLRVWLFVLPCAAGLLVLDELRKWVARRLGRPSRPPVATKDPTRFAAELG